jgi:hypothetical protein
MDKKLKSKWIKALTSGRYRQTTETLKDHNGYCCLGVLLTVTRKGRWDDCMYRIGSGDDEMQLEGDLNGFKEQIGITRAQQTALISMNDKQGASFKEIASWIRKYL